MSELLYLASLVVFMVMVIYILRQIYLIDSKPDVIVPEEWEKHYELYSKEINGEENE